jgi:hypothetical protein
MHRLRSGNPQSGPMFRNSAGAPMNLNNLLGRMILPALALTISERDVQARPN